MNKKLCILLLAVMLTACSDANISDSKAKATAASETTTTAVAAATDDDSVQTTASQVTMPQKETKATSQSISSALAATTTQITTTTSAAAQMQTSSSAVTESRRTSSSRLSADTASKAVQTSKQAPAATKAPNQSVAKPQSNVVWTESMKVWRKLCEGKSLTASEQEKVRSEIAGYASKFQGKTSIHVSFANDSSDITYPKPINLVRKKDMVDCQTNAHFDASVDMDCKALISYAKSDKEIYDIVASARNDALHLIDLGLHSRYEMFTGWGSLEYAGEFYYNIGVDGTYLWFLTEEI